MSRTYMPFLERLGRKFTVGDGCWEWTAGRDVRGYGRIQIDGNPRLAHRVVYELLNGPVPDGLELDHLCRNHGCVRPDHLEAVTHRENIRRSPTVGRAGLLRTHCVNGHEFTEANTYHRNDHPEWRQCRACDRERRAARRAS